MNSPTTITLTIDRRLIEHPRAFHLRRMRQGIWLYLDLLARLPAGADTLEVDLGAVGGAMGLPEPTIRSWLGHLAKAGYLKAERRNGMIRVILRDVHIAAPVSAPTSNISKPAAAATPVSKRFFTVERIAVALGESAEREPLEAVLGLYTDEQIKRALAGALAVPAEQIRRSRTALFLYLLKRHAHAQE